MGRPRAVEPDGSDDRHGSRRVGSVLPPPVGPDGRRPIEYGPSDHFGEEGVVPVADHSEQIPSPQKAGKRLRDAKTIRDSAGLS